jgi:hypothetical protein
MIRIDHETIEEIAPNIDERSRTIRETRTAGRGGRERPAAATGRPEARRRG